MHSTNQIGMEYLCFGGSTSAQARNRYYEYGDRSVVNVQLQVSGKKSMVNWARTAASRNEINEFIV